MRSLSRLSHRQGVVSHPQTDSASTVAIAPHQGLAGQRILSPVLPATLDPPCLRLQRRIVIGEPGDKWEREAQRWAGRIMGMLEPSVQLATAGPPNNGSRGGERESENTIIQGEGQPLPASERAFLEPRFGHDFSQVRIHADGQAAAAARALNARAFTEGADVIFGQGQYAPQSRAGRRLLAHELTHVVQQMPPRVSQGARSAPRLCQIPDAMVQRDGPAKEKTALEKLDELLDQFWPSDENILAHLRALNDSEKNRVVTDDKYRGKLVSQLSDKTMFDALKILGPDCPTRVAWLKAEGVNLHYLTNYGPNYQESMEGCSLDPDLKKRILDLCECLNALELVKHEKFAATSACRAKQKAHRLSTAYHILNGYVTLADLQSYLPVGTGEPGTEVRDMDGNLWYVSGWTLEQTKANAVKNWGGGKISLAYEGYEVGDPYRIPNTQDPKKPIVSSHAYGQAMDVWPLWIKDAWDAEHDKVIKSYGLTRPIDSSNPYGPSEAELWHYEKLKESSG
ncbi:MAG: DUF4157 domain-containing protein [Desulfobacterales bacterium]|nr:MAG: DUF4157 domain-containing protein [Desulfobacterales bacterium]